MKQLVLSHFPMKSLPFIGLMLFLGIFILMLFWIFRKGSDSFYKQMGELPLNNEKNERGSV